MKELLKTKINILKYLQNFTKFGYVSTNIFALGISLFRSCINVEPLPAYLYPKIKNISDRSFRSLRLK